MRATRGLCLLFSIFAGLRETLADSTLSNFHVKNTTSSQSRHFRKRQTQPNFGTLETAFRVATWVWTSDESPPLFSAPPGDRLFRQTYIPPTGKTAVSAEILVTVDNIFSLFVNGALVGVTNPSGVDAWKSAQGFQMALNPGPIVFALRGTNTPNAGLLPNNPAGILVAIRITHSDATQVLLVSDNTWRSSIQPVSGFELPSTDDSKWVTATVQAQYGSGPWGLSVTLPSALTTVTLPPSSSSSAPPSSSSAPPSSSASPSSTATLTSSTPLPSSSTLTITSTALGGDATALPSPSSTSSSSSSSRPALIGAILGGVLGGFALLALLLVCWRRKQKSNDEPAASIDTWAPAPHPVVLEPFMQQTVSTQSDQYGAEPETKYGQPQAPYRYPPPSQAVSAASSMHTAQADYYQPQYGGAGGNTQGHNSWGSNARLPPSRAQSAASVPQGGAQSYHSSPPARMVANPYENRYYQ